MCLSVCVCVCVPMCLLPVVCGDQNAPSDVITKFLSSKHKAGDIAYRRFDAASRDSTRELVEGTIASHGRLDVLVNNVGCQLDNGVPAHELPDDVWETVMAVNVTSFFVASKYMLRHTLARGGGGAIVNIASVQGLLSQRGVPAYAASKGAILSLTRQLAVEYSGKGVRVNAVCPGTINTPLVRRNVEGRGLDFARVADPYPIGNVSGEEERRG